MNQPATKTFSLKKTTMIVLAAIALPVLLFYWAVWSVQQSWQLTGKSANFVFRQLFYQPVPPGVSHLRFAGNTCPGEVYMRFQVQDPAAFIARLKSTKSLDIGISNNPLYFGASDKYAKSIHWQDALAIKHAIVYSFASAVEYKWDGNILVDKAARAVYVYGIRMD